jgi:HSP20 family protein
MAEAETKLQVKSDKGAVPQIARDLKPFDTLRRQVDQLFRDFDRGWEVWQPFNRSVFDLAPSWPTEVTWGTVPAVDVAEHERDYEITAELPGLDDKNIEVKVANGVLTIKGEKTEEKEEKKKDYHLSERRYGSFRRSFSLPDGVDPDKIEAKFQKGVLTITLPKSTEAQKQEKKIAVKAA